MKGPLKAHNPIISKVDSYKKMSHYFLVELM